VHVPGTYLYLEKPAVIRKHGRMQTLVAVGFRHGDVILEPSVQRLPEAVRDSKNRITIGGGFAQDPYSRKIVQFLGCLGSLPHFFIDGIEMLGSCRYRQLHPFIGCAADEFSADPLEEFLAFRLLARNEGLDLVECLAVNFL